MIQNMKRTESALVLVVLGLAWLASFFLLPNSALNRKEEVDFSAPDPLVLQILALGDPLSAADLTWLETTNYFGGQDGAEQWYARLSGLLNAIVSLDPEFEYAYLFGGNALSSSISGVDAADDILERGLKHFPKNWRFPFYIGLNAYIFRDDYKRAGQFIGQAAGYPGAPSFLAAFSTRLLASSGDCDESMRMVQSLLQKSKDKVVQKNLQERQRYLVWECNYQILEQVNQQYQKQKNTLPKSINAFVQSGILPKIPADPYGGHWSIDPDGKIVSSTHKKRLQVHVSKAIKEQIQKWR